MKILRGDLRIDLKHEAVPVSSAEGVGELAEASS
jgi:hypothetical protein